MKTVRVGDVDLGVEDRGNGRPIVFVHGFPLDHSMWQAQLDALSSEYRVIAPDLRGFGASTVTPGTVTMEQFADDLDSLLSELGVDEPVVLCGLSMGGYVAWQFWRRHGQRLRALVLCDTRAAPDTAEAQQNRQTLAAHVLEQGAAVVAEAMTGKLFSETTQHERRPVVTACRDVMLRTHPEGIAAALRGMAERIDARPWLAEIALPALVIVGADDAITPADEMRSVAAALPQCEFVEVPEAGHMAPLENPTVVNDALARFLHSLP